MQENYKILVVDDDARLHYTVRTLSVETRLSSA